MFSSDNFDSLAKEVMAKLSEGNIAQNSNGSSTSSSNGNTNCNSVSNGTGECKNVVLTPSVALVIAGLLGGALEVDSVLVDRSQEVQIVLVGSLKIKKKTELEKLLDQIGSKSFDEVVKTMLERLK